MGLRKGPILPIVQTNGPHNPQVKTGKCNCRRQGAVVVAGGALYIDLNPVRAGLVADPKDYRFCGYGEAVAGHQSARAGLCHLHGGDWRHAHAAHRIGLFGTGSAPRTRGAMIDPTSFEKVLRQKGQLPLTDVLRCRVRYFTDAAVLGSEAFVATQLAAFRRRHGTRERTAPRPLAPIADWGGLVALRGLRRSPFG